MVEGFRSFKEDKRSDTVIQEVNTPSRSLISTQMGKRLKEGAQSPIVNQRLPNGKR